MPSLTTLSTRPIALAAGALAIVMAMGLTSVAEAGRYSSGGDKGGEGASARYEKYLEEEAKREKAKALRSQAPSRQLQKAGELPVVPGAAAGAIGVTPYDHNDQHNRGR